MSVCGDLFVVLNVGTVLLLYCECDYFCSVANAHFGCCMAFNSSQIVLSDN